MTDAALAVGLLLGVGFLVTRRLVDRWLEQLVAAPLLGALVLVPAGVAAVATSTSPIPWTVLAVLAAAAWSWRGSMERVWSPTSGLLPALVLLGVVFVIVGFHLERPPVEWDAHSIWLFHSSWYAEGGRAAHGAFTLESFSHPEYPPLLTAPAGITSRLVAGRLEWRAGQSVITAIGWSAFATALLVLLDGARRTWAVAAGAVAVAVTATAVLGLGVASGEADLAAAGTTLLVAVALLVRRRPELVPLGLAAGAAGALCKGESFVAAIALLGIGWWAAGRPRSGWWAAPVLAGVGWQVVARLLGAESYLTAGPNRGFTPDRLLDRAWPSLDRLVHEVGPVGPAAALATVACAVAVPAARRPLLLLWLAAAGYLAGLVAVYVYGDVPLDQWLTDSARRVAGGPAVLLATAAVVAVDRALDLLLSPRRAPRHQAG